MKILIVHEVNYLAKIIYEFQILAETLSSLGHDVTIVDYDDSWRESKSQPLWELRTRVHENIHRTQSQSSVTVRRPGMIRVPLLSRISAAATTFFDVDRLLRSGRFDAVLMYGLPTVGVQTLISAKRRRIPIYFRSIDILHRLVPYPPLVPVTRAMEGFVYRRVDAITAVTPRLKQHVESYGVPGNRVDVLPSGVDAQMFKPGPCDVRNLAGWNIRPDDRIVLFMGTIYPFSGLDHVIRNWPQLLGQVPKAKLFIVGIGSDAERLKRIAAESAVADHVVFTGMQPYASLPDWIRCSEVCINPFDL